MSVVRISDVIQTPVYDSYTAINNPATSALARSGVLVSSPVLNAYAESNAVAVTIPFWNDLDPAIEPNYGNDDPNDIAAPNKINAGFQTVRKTWLNQMYGAMDLTRELSTSDPMRQIKNRFGEYWVRQLQYRLIASALGVMADNIANDAGDMVNNISLETTVGVGAANLFSRDAYVDAAFTLGDQFGAVTAIAVHSVVYKKMVKLEDIDFIPDSQGNLTIPTYLGALVLVDDGMPIIAGTTSGFRYVSALYGRGAFLMGEGTPTVPSWTTRTEENGNGQGSEVIGERNEWIVHPNGFSWVEGTLTEFSPTLADLRLASHWNRNVYRKQAKMAFLITNG